MGRRLFQTKTEWVAEEIRKAIREGRLRPGDRLRLHEWATLLGVSPTPLREAMKALAAEGYLHITPHKGAQVTAFSSRDFLDLCRLVAVLDSLAAELAAERLRGQKREALCSRLDRLTEEMRRAFAGHDVERASALNVEFHRTIYEGAQSSLLSKVRAPLYDAIPVIRQSFWSMVAASPELLDEHCREHLGIVEALRTGDAACAAKLTRDHLERNLHKLVQLQVQGVGVR
jgi:DNA-binding GntR family transcriptional regulator